MSTRRRAAPTSPQVTELQKELCTLRQAALDASAEVNGEQQATLERFEASKAFEALTPTEQAAASLGVHPEAFRPIGQFPPTPIPASMANDFSANLYEFFSGFMNTAHYATLLKANALDDDLARRIEAYKSISA